MSADSSKRQSKQGISGQAVLPQPVNDPSIIDSVAGFIHEVVPQAYQSVISAASGSEVSKESIVWAKFHNSDYNDPDNFLADTECQSDSVPPLLIILGYGSGVQVWGVSGGGEGRELLSYPQGNVRCLQVLHTPQLPHSKDALASKRPLIAIVDNSGPGPQYQTLNFISLRTAEVVKSIKFKTPICDVVSNRKSIVVTFPEKIAIFEVLTLEDRMTVTTCYPSPGINPNPVALGPRWLAYCDKKLTTWQRSSGGCEDEGAQSYTATVIHAAKSLGKGLRDLSGSLTGTTQQPISTSSQPGIVTVIDIETPRTTKHQTGEEDQSSASNMVAHFVGHTGPIVAMTFDPSGMLLVVADKHGHRFNVFRLHPHPSSPALAAVHHLYILYRGDTTARVQDITVSWDSRWVAVSSLRGTTHVFPITPYGGPVAVRTHTTPHVVNRLSRFERSAGLSDGRGSPEGAASVLGGSPRLPPYPHPVVLAPLAQIRRTPTGGETSDAPPVPQMLRLAARFAPPRALLPPRATPPRTPRHQPKPRVADSLFVISSYGSLVQYDIEPRSPANVPKDKISYDTGIEVAVEAKGEWVLLRPPCVGSVQPPLVPGNPLLPPAPAIQSHSSRLVETHSPQLHHPAKGQDDRWLSQVEIITHFGPHRRLWMGPQFSFKSLDQSNADGEQAEPENIPPRSNPVNMPRRPYLWIESSSGGSVEAPYMTDNSEDDSIHGETRLREDLADAMMDTALHASGGVVEGGEDRLASGLEGVDKAVERRITQFGLVVPISPVVLPDIRVPILPEELASRINIAATTAQGLASTFVATSVTKEVKISPETSCVMDTSSSKNSPEISLELNAGIILEEQQMVYEVSTSTDEYTNVSLPSITTHADAQTETLPLQPSPPIMTDKSLNTSMIFEPSIRLPLTSSSSDTSSKISEQTEGSSVSTEKSSNSSSENGSGHESVFKKPEKPGKKSRKRKKDDKSKETKTVESIPPLPASVLVETTEITETAQFSESSLTALIDINVSDESPNEAKFLPETTTPKDSIFENVFVEAIKVSDDNERLVINKDIDNDEADLIVFTPNEKTTTLAEDIIEHEITTSSEIVPSISSEFAQHESETIKIKEMVTWDDVELSEDFSSSNSESAKIVSEPSKDIKPEISSTESCPSRRESGKGKKKKKFSDNLKSSSSRDECKSEKTDVDASKIISKNVKPEFEIEPPLIQFVDTQNNNKGLDAVANVNVQEKPSDAEITSSLPSLMIKREISSDDDKISSKDSENSKVVESTESTESSGKEFQVVSSKKKGRSKKHKVQSCSTIKDAKKAVPSPEQETQLQVEQVRTELEVSDIHVEKIEEDKGKLEVKETIESEVEKVITHEIIFSEGDQEQPDKLFVEEVLGTVEDIEEGNKNDDVAILDIPVIVPPSEEVSTVDEMPASSSDQISTKEETSDNINRSDSEFFIPVVEKKKKKRKNTKEKESIVKLDVKETLSTKPDTESTQKEDGSLDSRRQRRESRSKAKSPSPSPKGDVVVDSESSDEAILAEVKPQTPKQPKRKKPSKRSDASLTREQTSEIKSKSEGASDIDYETCSEKKSDSSVESFFDRIRVIDPFSKSWTGSGGTEDKSTFVEDKDSIYESCNDDEFSSVVPNPGLTVPETTPLESSSSMTEDKTDSGDKDGSGFSQATSKKHKKQKKKKR